MEDWCKVVVYWLNGNEIRTKNILNLKSRKGIKFFLNK